MEDIIAFKKMKDKFQELPSRERFLFLTKFYPKHVENSPAWQDGVLLLKLLFNGRHRPLVVEGLQRRFETYGKR